MSGSFAQVVKKHRAAALRCALACGLAVWVSACATGPPVQEMSDARQAIAVAKEAGAEEKAADDIREAEAYLESAQKKLAERSYAQARRDALAAKAKALNALSMSEHDE